MSEITQSKGYMSDDEFAVFYREFTSLDLTASQEALATRWVPPPPSEAEYPYILALRNRLRPCIERMLNAFNLYYGFSEEERQRIMGYYPAALRIALILTKPEHVDGLKSMRRADVYPIFWDILLLENFKMMLLPINYVFQKVLDTGVELDGLEDSAFRKRFETEWAALKRYRDPYYGYWVQPRISLNNIVRYLQLPRGNRETRFQASDYLLHLCQERPSVLEVVYPLFKDKAFRDRVKAAYKPLTDKVARRIIRRSKANPQEAAGQYGRDVRSAVGKAFDKSLRKFDYHYKERPEIPGMPRWPGMIGGLSEDVKTRIQERVELQLVPDWDREIAFPHFMKQKLEYLVTKMTGDAETVQERSRSARTDRLPEDDHLAMPDEMSPQDDDTDDVPDASTPIQMRGRLGAARIRKASFLKTRYRDLMARTI